MAKSRPTTTRTSKTTFVKSRRALRAVTAKRTLTDGTEVEGGLEQKVGNSLIARVIKFVYGKFRVPYVKPAKPTFYRPDFVLENGIIIETKGWFPSEDRTKMRHVKDTHPDLDIRIVFSRASTKIGKKSETTYAMWCERYGFPYAEGDVPVSWIKEPADPKRLAANEAAFQSS